MTPSSAVDSHRIICQHSRMSQLPHYKRIRLIGELESIEVGQLKDDTVSISISFTDGDPIQLARLPSTMLDKVITREQISAAIAPHFRSNGDGS